MILTFLYLLFVCNICNIRKIELIIKKGVLLLENLYSIVFHDYGVHMSLLKDKYFAELQKIKAIQRKADCLVQQFFEKDSYDTSSLLKELRLVSAVSSMLQRTLDKELDFEEIKENEAEAEIRDIHMTLKDTQGLLEKVLIEIKALTGKTIKFKSDMK